MWKAVSQVLANEFGAYYSIKTKEKIHTGEMNEAWLINDGITPVFVKVNEKRYRSMFLTEADQLTRLAKTGTITVPQVYGVGCSHSHSFLLLEAFSFNPLSSDIAAEFGRQVANLHSYEKPDHYGLDFDTWLGPIHQPNEWQPNWAKFFSEQRIGWQLQICKEKGLHFGDIASIVQTVKYRLNKHCPTPSLLHGNLWIENCGACQTASGKRIVVYDPACYWGDRECDLAFSELFEPFPREFYTAYNEVFPLKEDYDERKGLYQLYYLLNFSHRFQGHYIALTKKHLQNIMKETL